MTAEKKKSSWQRKATRIGVVVAVPYLILLVAVFCLQLHLIYVPAKVYPSLALAIASRSGFEPWYNGSGQVIGWKQVSKAAGAHPRILITHGNGGFALDRVDYARSLCAAAD